MGTPNEPLTFTPDQIADLNGKLGDLRHNINNNLSLVVAALELLRRKPEMGERMLDAISEQPQKIIEEMRKFSDEFEKAFQIQRD